MSRTLRAAAALAIVVCSVVAMSACATQPTPEPEVESGRPQSTAPADATLRGAAPAGLLIGSAVAGGGHHAAQDYPDPFPNDEPYRELLASEFSSLTPENQLKWEFVHPSPDEYDFGPADAIVEFAEQNGQAVRGHTLMWHSQNPPWLASLDVSDDELRELLHDHITTVVGRYAGRIAEWDVANELFTDAGEWRTENPWVDRLGQGIVADAFRWAHEADPDARLFLNDYNIETAGPKSDAVLALADQLIGEGVPIGGIGVQGHLSMQYPEPAGMAANLQRFADLGLAVAITELDVRMPLDGEPTDAQLAQQAEWFAMVLDACLSTGACSSVTLWGATDKYSWVPAFFPDEGAATPWWEDLTRKPAYDALWERLGTEG